VWDAVVERMRARRPLQARCVAVHDSRQPLVCSRLVELVRLLGPADSTLFVALCSAVSHLARACPGCRRSLGKRAMFKALLKSTRVWASDTAALERWVRRRCDVDTRRVHIERGADGPSLLAA
jgi:hypothetical protein